MKVLLISTSDIRGGAAIAAFRLMNALNANGQQAKMMVREKLSDNANVVQVGRRLTNKWNFLTERVQIFTRNRFSRKHLFDVSTAINGINITSHPLFKEADVIHLHWINQAMLSLNEMGRIISSGKKVVWTMHDMWPFTGICHHAADCEQYEKGCGQCPYLGSNKNNDLSAQLFAKKQQLLTHGKINFVSVSSWLAVKARKSPILLGHSIEVIPNIIDTNLFSPSSNSTRSDNHIKTIVMGAARLDHPIKGFHYLKEALQILVNENRINLKDIRLLLFGDAKDAAELLNGIPVEYEYVGPVYEVNKVVELYRQANVVVVPSLYETFGQTLTEGMACGCPGVSFDNSGQRDIINHKANGYLARYKDPADLAEGIYWTLYEADWQLLSQSARNKVVTHYAEEVVAKEYIQLYNRLCAH